MITRSSNRAFQVRLVVMAFVGSLFLGAMFSAPRTQSAIFPGPRFVATDAPTNLVVSATSNASISLSWNAPATSVTSYQVERSDNVAGTFIVIGSTGGTTFNDATVTSLHAYLYRVRAVLTGGCQSSPSNIALGTAISFEFSQLQNQPIKARHLNDVRTAINAVRAVANLSPATWTHSPLDGLAIQASDVQESRDRLTEALTALDIPIDSYQDPILNTGANGTPIRAIHIEQLQTRSTRGVRAFASDQTCDVGATVLTPGDVPFVSTDKGEVNLNLGDYGVIFQSALQETNSGAWDLARNALFKKIESTLAAGSHYDAVLNRTVGPYQGWLEGANVSLIMASGLLLSDPARNLLTAPVDSTTCSRNPATCTLDSAIRRVIGSYVFNRDAGCGFSDGRWRGQNTCMDDYAVAATSFAWIAAYKYQRGDSGVSYYVNAANNAISQALGLNESVCAYVTGTSWDPTSSRGPCSATIDDLRTPADKPTATPAAETISLNHGQESIPYGLGLMTSISSAFIALQTANANPSLTPDQQAIALALFREAEKTSHTAPDGSEFEKGCYQLALDNASFQSNNAYCGDIANAYKPKMFPVRTFYTQVLGLTPPCTGGYQFSDFDTTLFVKNPFFNKGRQVVYGDLTQCWWSSRPSLGPTLPQQPAEIAFVKPSYASSGPANTLTVGGWARSGPSGVELRWRDVTTGDPEQVVSFQPTPGADTSWSNTLPSSNYCHDYEVYVNYAGTTSNTFMYSGLGSGYCPEVARLSWVQPQWSAGFGPAGSLVVAGTAANAPAGTLVKLYWRDISLSGPSNVIDFAAPVGSDGTWYNSIPDVNYSHVYELYAKYDVFASRPCRYNGNQLPNSCEVNFAIGATVTASSTYSASYPVSAVNNGDRKGINWGAGGGWNDATADSYPDWVQVDFNGAQTIDQINVFTLQDNYTSPIEPAEALTFSTNGLTNFSVDYSDISAGTWRRVPGANAVSNNKVWTRFLFSPLTTSKIRVNVTGALASFSRITEIEAWGEPPSKFNYASAIQDGVHTSSVITSSTYNAAYPGEAVIDGDRKGLNWGAGGGWNDATANAFPDWVQINFAGPRTIDEINVFTLQDNYTNPVDPTETMTFTTWGITAFEVQYFNGSTWVDVPGGNVLSGNDKVWRRFDFAPITTSSIRVLVNDALGGYSRITEVEALGW